MLRLNIPGNDAALQHTVETRPKAVADWLARLPFANAADTARQLLVALHALNRHPLGEDDRHTLLALYRPVIERATASLDALLADALLPPNAQQRQIGSLLRELGRGAFAHVYLARQPALGNRMVVVKVAQYGSAEAETLGRLAHRNIVPVYSVVEDPATHMTAVCMPYLGSATLLDVLDLGYQDNRPPAQASVHDPRLFQNRWAQVGNQASRFHHGAVEEFTAGLIGSPG